MGLKAGSSRVVGTRRRMILIVVTVCSSAASGALCFTMYWLVGIPLFPSGAVGRVLLLAPLVTPLVVAPAVAVPVQRATTRVATLLEEVEAAKAELAGEIAERKTAQARLEELVRTDPLTAVLNRRGFFERFAALGKGDLVVASIDVDLFKHINDLYGHAAGDAALVAVAAELTGAVGRTGIVARMGGDEFAVVVPATETEAVERLTNRLRELTVERADGPPLQVACSVGTVRSSGGRLPDEALAAADEQMYLDKRTRVLGAPSTARL
jgi:diguanylate cyclase (GGDEF)-like protein